MPIGRDRGVSRDAAGIASSAAGIFALLALAWLISENRRARVLEASRRRPCGDASSLAVVLLKVPRIARAFGAINDAVDAIAAASRAGTSFVFGYLGGGPLPFELKFPGAEFVLAFQALPIVLLMSVLTTLLFYWRILPPIVRGFSWALERTLGVGGAVGLSTAANIFRRHGRGAAVHPPLSRAASRAASCSW